MEVGYDTVVVECKYFTDDDDVGATDGGGLGGETEHCFGSITVEPPIDLNTCTSLPSEITLEVREHALSVIDIKIVKCNLTVFSNHRVPSTWNCRRMRNKRTR